MTTDSDISMMSNMTFPLTKSPPKRRPMFERIRVKWQNWRVRDVGRAVEILSKALRDDPQFRQSWHANIAMPIYDATRPKCHCIHEQVWNDHAPGCEVFAAETVPRRYECREMSIEQANHIADRLMKHLFGA